MTVRTPTPLIAPKSISKPSIRKHSSSEKLFMDQDQPHFFNQQQQQQQQLQQLQYQDMAKLPTVLSFSPALHIIPPPDSKPSKKASSHFISTCACFLVFFFVTAIVFLHCMNLADIPPDNASPVALQQNSPRQSFLSEESDTSAPKINALRGLGTLFRRGTKAMNELVVAHVGEDADLRDLRLFLRTLHRSGVTARADVVFLFATGAMHSTIVDAINEENEYFYSLLLLLSNSSNSTDSNAETEVSDLSLSSSPLLLPSSSSPLPISNATISAFNLDAFIKKTGSGNKSSSSQSLWGFSVNHNSSADNDESSALFEWGSIVAFDVSELNPDDSFQGFIDRPPVVLRRWACYQMLLGMVRHKFKHVLLTDVYGVAVLGDALAMARRKAGLYVPLEDRSWGESLTEVTKRKPPTGEDVKDRKQEVDAGLEARMEMEMVAEGVRRGILRKAEGGGGSATLRARNLKISAAAQSEAHRRRMSGALRRRKGRRAPQPPGVYEKVYGKEMWSGMEEAEKSKKLVDGGVMAGGIQQVRGLANAMVTEIVRVSLERNSREAFPDSVLLSYLLHRSSPVLGKRVLDHIHLLDNSESFVHAMASSMQPSSFVKRSGQAYAVLHGRIRSRRWNQAMQAIRGDICLSPAEAQVYRDCATEEGTWWKVRM